MLSCNLCCLLIFLHGHSRTYSVASLRAGPVGRISYNLYVDCKHVRYVTCDLTHKYNFLFFILLLLILIIIFYIEVDLFFKECFADR